jgi:Xaa-Pro aminopeptidase
VAGHDPLLVTYPMEREEAAATGLQTRIVHDPNLSPAAIFDAVLRDLGAREPVAIIGHAPVQLYLGVAEEMSRSGWRLVHSIDPIELARKRKSAEEVELIRSVGARTEAILEEVRTILRQIESGRKVLIGDLKTLISSEIARHGLVEDHETIVSQGRDAAVPHSRGNAAAEVRRSSPLVIDIFPADRNSGYFFDMTPTFCIGKVPDELRRLHADVLEAFTLSAREMRPGTPAKSWQARACDFFEQRGYPTIRSNPATVEGYVHGLGHGVGLEIHEKPSFALRPANNDLVETGDVLTIEPGLYFPERGLGVRIEDTFVVKEDGVESLCRSRRDLLP